MKRAALTALTVMGTASLMLPGAATAQTRAQIERQYQDECSAPTDDPDVLASCDRMAAIIGAKPVQFTGDYPPIPSREGAGFATALQLSLYKQNCSIPKPTATAAQCNEWRRDIEERYSEMDFPRKPKATPLPTPPAKPLAPRCDGCPTKAAQ